jgi:hypothetical protein
MSKKVEWIPFSAALSARVFVTTCHRMSLFAIDYRQHGPRWLLPPSQSAVVPRQQLALTYLHHLGMILVSLQPTQLTYLPQLQPLAWCYDGGVLPLLLQSA